LWLVKQRNKNNSGKLVKIFQNSLHMHFRRCKKSQGKKDAVLAAKACSFHQKQ
jgi:hypothetical protein